MMCVPPHHTICPVATWGGTEFQTEGGMGRFHSSTLIPARGGEILHGSQESPGHCNKDGECLTQGLDDG